MARHVLTDQEWNAIKDELPPEDEPRRGRPWVSHRMVVSGILWILNADAPWRDLPESFGKWKTVYNRFRRWTREGLGPTVDGAVARGTEPSVWLRPSRATSSGVTP